MGRRSAVFPRYADRAFGQGPALGALEALLGEGARLVTLVGPPGVGKTRLAVELAHRVGGERVFVDLVPARTADDVLRAVAAALGLARSPHDSEELLAHRIARFLGRPTRAARLIVLDNAEQVVAGVARWVGDWLAVAPRLRLLCTSRELLRASGEQAYEVQPLAPPRAVDALPTNHAVALLVARAPGYTPVPEDLEHLERIAHELDGIPLALELAATRLRLFGAAELSAKLGSRLDLLAHGRRDTRARHATLREALDASWELLDARERRALPRLAVFRGTFSVDAACATIGGAAVDALEALHGLRDKSLVARDASGRLRLLESVREYAAEKVEGTEHVTALAEYLAGEGAHRVAQTRQDPLALRWLVTERDNLLAAYDALPPEAPPELGGGLLLALDAVVERVGPATLLDARLDAALRRADLPPALRVALARGRSRGLRFSGRGEAASALLERVPREGLAPQLVASLDLDCAESLLLGGALADAESVAARVVDTLERRPTELRQRALAVLGLVHHSRGELSLARVAYIESLDLAVSLGDARAEANAHRDLGTLSTQLERRDEARAHYERAIARSPGDDLRLEAIVHGNLGILSQEEGALDAAVDHLRRGLSSAQAIGERMLEAHLLGYLGTVRHERGDVRAARESYDAAIALLRVQRDARLESVFVAARAVAHAMQGRHGDARIDLDCAARRVEEVGDPGLVAMCALHDAHARWLADPAAPQAAAARAVLDAQGPAARSSDDARFALRLLARSLPSDRLAVAPGGHAFQLSGATRVDLSTRTTLARVLDALATAREREPGRALELDALLAAGWPGEKVMRRAAENRVRVALTSLRNLGLRTVLLRHGGGHLLDPAVALDRPRAV